MNRLTDLYNAVSVLHQIPIGGEDLTRYTGPPRLVRATAEDLLTRLAGLGPDVHAERRRIRADPTHDEGA